jgi:TonB family protein
MISRAALLLVVVTGAMNAQSPTPPSAPPLPRIYLDFQVERPVTASPKNTPPRYPIELRKANIEGDVLAKFVVDSTGHAIMSTFEVIRTHHDLFTRAVKDALPLLVFTPASIQGRKVAQLVQMPFVFSLAPRDTGSMSLYLPPRLLDR